MRNEKWGVWETPFCPKTRVRRCLSNKGGWGDFMMVFLVNSSFLARVCTRARMQIASVYSWHLWSYLFVLYWLAFALAEILAFACSETKSLFCFLARDLSLALEFVYFLLSFLNSNSGASVHSWQFSFSLSRYWLSPVLRLSLFFAF